MGGEKKVRRTSRQLWQEEERLCSSRIPTSKNGKNVVSIMAERHLHTSLLLPWNATLEQIKMLMVLCHIPSSVQRTSDSGCSFQSSCASLLNLWNGDNVFCIPSLSVFYIAVLHSAWHNTFPAPKARIGRPDTVLLLVVNTVCPCCNTLLKNT